MGSPEIQTPLQNIITLVTIMFDQFESTKRHDPLKKIMYGWYDYGTDSGYELFSKKDFLLWVVQSLFFFFFFFFFVGLYQFLGSLSSAFSGSSDNLFVKRFFSMDMIWKIWNFYLCKPKLKKIVLTVSFSKSQLYQNGSRINQLIAIYTQKRIECGKV